MSNNRRGVLTPVSNEHRVKLPPPVEETRELPAKPEVDDAPAQLPTTRKRNKE